MHASQTDTDRLPDLDFLQGVKLVNFVRKQSNKSAAISIDFGNPKQWEDDQYLLPVLEDDAFLFSIDELDQLDSTNGIDSEDAIAGKQPLAAAVNGDEAVRVVELEQQLAKLQADFTEYRDRVSATLEERWAERPETAAGSSAKASDEAKNYEEGYFESYSYNDIHQTMLQDTVRTDAYRDFIYGNKHLFKDKVVLDVGCGTGILSMFCAKAGAKQVIAIDNSAIIGKAKQIAFANGLSDRITFVQTKVEEMTALPSGIEEVDIIVSEWMGYCLLFEDMLPSVLYARDKWLKSDGLMVPSHCSIHLTPLAEPDWIADNVTFWHDVYGFDMSTMMEGACDEVVVRSQSKEAVCGRTEDSQAVKVFDLWKVQKEDLQFQCSFEVKLDRDVDALDAWCAWFDICFSATPASATADSSEDMEALGKQLGAVTFTTSPLGKQTHWQSGVCIIERKGISAKEVRAGTSITGNLRFAKGEEARALRIEIDWKAEGAVEQGRQVWKMR